MASGIYLALSGAVAQSTALDVVANNIANAATAAYRAQRLSFGEVLTSAGPSQPSVRVATTLPDPAPGPITDTGNPLDVALQGDGWLVAQTPRGDRYLRGGPLHVDPQGRLVTVDGYPLKTRDGRGISLPTDAAEPSLDADGTVHSGEETLGTLALVQLPAAGLTREGASLFASTAPPIAGAPPPEIISGALETSNFNVVRGMVDLVRVSRTYEALHRMIESYREIDERTARAGS